MVTEVGFATANLVANPMYAWLNPRIRLGERKVAGSFFVCIPYGVGVTCIVGVALGSAGTSVVGTGVKLLVALGMCGVTEGTGVSVGGCVLVAVAVGVGVAVGVEVGVGVLVGVGVGVGIWLLMTTSTSAKVSSTLRMYSLRLSAPVGKSRISHS